MRDLTWFEDSLAALDRVYFHDTLGDVRLEWARYRKPASPERVTFGLCYADERLVRLSRLLARTEVPDFYALFILYHELLHIVVSREHDAAFDLAERRFVHYTEAKVWESPENGNVWRVGSAGPLRRGARRSVVK